MFLTRIHSRDTLAFAVSTRFVAQILLLSQPSWLLAFFWFIRSCHAGSQTKIGPKSHAGDIIIRLCFGNTLVDLRCFLCRGRILSALVYIIWLFLRFVGLIPGTHQITDLRVWLMAGTKGVWDVSKDVERGFAWRTMGDWLKLYRGLYVYSV